MHKRNAITWSMATFLNFSCVSEALEAASPAGSELRYDTWTWMPVDGTRCGSGTGTGIAINPHAGSERLTVYVQGGGSCFSAERCGIPTDPPSVWHLDGYDEETFDTDLMAGLYPADYQVFDRSDSANPFARDNFVFIPYCTGDVHSGSNVQRYSDDLVVHHVGYDNITLDLKVIRALFPEPTHLVVAGTSAGGFGAVLNFARFREAWPDARAYLIDDAAPVLPGVAAWYAAQDAVWHNFANMPAGCTDCTTPDGGPHRIFAYLAERADLSAALLSWSRDRTMSGHYSLPPSTQDNTGCQTGGTCDFEAGLHELTGLLSQAKPGLIRAFIPDGNLHGFLPTRFDTVAAGVPLKQFLSEQLADADDWSDVVEPNW